MRREQQAAEEDVLERPREAQGSSQLRALVDVDSVFVELIWGFHTLGGKYTSEIWSAFTESNEVAKNLMMLAL